VQLISILGGLGRRARSVARFALLFAGVVGCAGLASKLSARTPAQVAFTRAPARAAASLADVSQSPSEASRATLDPKDPAEAREINRRIPFAAGPVEPARRFVLKASGADRERAIDCMAAAIYYEAGFEPLDGQRAVAQVVLNRVRHPAFPKTVCGVVFEGAGGPGCQFSFACDGALARAPEAAALKRARRVALEALNGRVQPLIGASTHYHADYVVPYWGRELLKVRQIGAHIFYRWPGEAGARATLVGVYAGHEPSSPLAPTQVAAQTETASAPAVGSQSGGLVVSGLGWTPSPPTVSDAGSAYQRSVDSQAAGSATGRLRAAS
jgi:spore germination cell wall hydrolase CwlJ-like protein